MSHIYVPSPAPLPSAGVTLPDDDDKAEVADVNVPFETILDAIARLESQWIQIPINPINDTNSTPLFSARWTFDVSLGLWVQHDITDPGALWVPLGPTPDAGTLAEVEIEVDGDAGPAAVGHPAVPSPAPSLAVFRVEAGVMTQIGSTATDGSGSVSAYHTPHTIAVTGLAEALSKARTYLARINGEAGASARANELAVYRLSARITG